MKIEKEIELEIKKILIKEIKYSCEIKIKNEISILKSQEIKLKNYKIAFLSQIEIMKKFLSKKNEYKNTLLNSINELNKEIKSNNNFINEFKDIYLNKINCYDFVNIKNPEEKFIQIISIEATIEDMYIILKIGFERGVINFKDTMKFIRALSNEAFKIKFNRDIIKNNYHKFI